MSLPKNILNLRRPISSTQRFLGILFRFQSTTTTTTPDIPKENSKKLSNADASEIIHHGKIAGDWWNPNGTLIGLHSMNEIRVPFIRDGLIGVNATKPELQDTAKVLDGIQILEVGCGGGILTEPLARLHANVTAIDVGAEVIAAAKDHLEKHSAELKERITYNVQPIEEHALANESKYDAVVLSEVIEHVTDKNVFLKSCIATLKPGGSVFITTPNKTIPMWVGGILLAENVFNLVPKGTHHYEKFVTPLELQRMLDSVNCSTVLVNGCVYQFWQNKWKWVPTSDFCYALHAVKN